MDQVSSQRADFFTAYLQHRAFFREELEEARLWSAYEEDCMRRARRRKGKVGSRISADPDAVLGVYLRKRKLESFFFLVGVPLGHYPLCLYQDREFFLAFF